MAPEPERLAVGERAGLAIRDVVDGDHRRDLAAQGRGLRGDGEELVQRAALVGLEVREADVAEARRRQHGLDRLADEREHPARAGVEEQRLLVDDQVLVEGESAGHRVTGVLIR